MKTIDVGVLGATGTVGRELLRRLKHHPWFRVAEVAGSDASAGALFDGRRLKRPTDPWDSPLLFSALPSAVARELEPELAGRGHAVVSNASAHRMAETIPLVVPEVNGDHVRLTDAQVWDGRLVTNPNCAVAGLVVGLAPLHSTFGITHVTTTTFQAISGAGRSGPAAGTLIDNVLPFIGGEEDKVETEPQRILGSIADGRVEAAGFTTHATCTRVPVLHGHLVSATVRLNGAASIDDVFDAFESESGLTPRAALPSSPECVLHVFRDDDRPQPRLDRDRGDGMTVSVGRIRIRGDDAVSFLVLSHNLGRGAAGAALQNAELLHAEGLLP